MRFRRNLLSADKPSVLPISLMIHLWFNYDLIMIYLFHLWFTYALLSMYLSLTYDLIMIHLWFSYDLLTSLIIYSWFTCDLLMIFFWFTYDLPECISVFLETNRTLGTMLNLLCWWKHLCSWNGIRFRQIVWAGCTCCLEFLEINNDIKQDASGQWHHSYWLHDCLHSLIPKYQQKTTD